MTDDISEIEQGATCYVISNSSTIYSYSNYIRYTYTNLGGKWYKTAQTSYNNLPINTLCRPYTDIESISSNAAFEPLYVFNSAVFAVFVLCFCIWLLFGRIFKYGL